MSETILFSLEHCTKCEQTKRLLHNNNDIKMITLPHDISEWTNEQKNLVETYDVIHDLERTAPVLWDQGQKKIGYLQIKQWYNQQQKE
jgi:glutaredoxin